MKVHSFGGGSFQLLRSSFLRLFFLPSDFVWKERNKDRHGHDDAEKKERVRRRNLREIAMWCEHRNDGKPDLDSMPSVLCDTCHEHARGRRSSFSRDVALHLSANADLVQTASKSIQEH